MHAAREVVGLAWPITVAMIGDTAMGLVDTKIVASLGKAPLGGVGVATTLMFVVYTFVFGFMRGVKVRTAHAVGEGRPHDGLAYAGSSMVAGVLVGAAAFAAARSTAPVFVALGVDAPMIPFAGDFLAARTWGAPAIALLAALVQHRQALGDTRTPAAVGILGNVLNAVLAWALVHGHLGMPALGVAGAGYATAASEWTEAALLLVLFARDVRAARRSSVRLRGLRRALREVADLGLPTGIQFGLEALAFGTFTAILGGIASADIAAHQIAFAVIRTSFLPGIAVAEAASVLVGKALGARRTDEADRTARAAIVVAAAFMTVCGMGFALGGGAVARSFTDDVDVAAIATKLLFVAAVFQTLDAVTIVLRGVLRAAGDVRVVALVGVTVAWCCVPGAAYVFGRLAGLGAFGGWLGFVGETTIAAAIFWRRWTRGAWRSSFARLDLTPELTPMPAE